MESSPSALVFFSYARERIGLARWLKVLWRSPETAKSIFVSSLTQRLSGSVLQHVAIGFDDIVLDPTIAGDRTWPLITYAEIAPRLAWCFQVPLAKQINIHEIKTDTYRSKPVARAIVRWATGGIVSSNDCVSVVAQCLRSGGVNVPRWVTTPMQLFCYLRAEDYHCVDFGQNPPGSVERDGFLPQSKVSTREVRQAI